MKIEYISKRFHQKTLDLIEVANTIIDDYQSRGYELTLRQLYYQLVAKDLIPNTEKSYSKLGITISNARDAGLVDWIAIVDRTRSVKGLISWNSPQAILKAVSSQYRIDKWQNQKYRLFVWVEKEALAGVIQRACEDENIQVDYLACRGYMSASTIWGEAQKIARIYAEDQIPVIIHLGDHDPSGIDMTRDNIERLQTYTRLFEPEHFLFKRIALNWQQIEQYQPPPNPAKITDSRFNGYEAEYGSESFELDALDPDVLVDLIQSTINEYKVENKWKTMSKKEQDQKKQLVHLTDNWQRIVKLMENEE